VENAAAILEALEPLADSAPHYYVHLLAAASELELLPSEAARAIHKVAGILLEKHGVELEARAWPLVEAVRVYANLLTKHWRHFRDREIESMKETMCGILEKLGGQLRVVAKARALGAALARGFKPCGGEEPAVKAKGTSRGARKNGEGGAGQAS